VIVYFPQEELFYRLYKNIFSRVSLYKITVPAFLWQRKLSKYIKDINRGQKAFIHIYYDKAYICFFSNGHFLFSRLIAIPETEDYIEQLAYEVAQSFRLFSQKVKKEIEKIYLISSEKITGDKLSTFLDTDVMWISDKLELVSPSLELINKLGFFAFITESDLLNVSRFFCYRKEKTFREWSFFQDIGIITGILCLLFMLMELILMPSIIPFKVNNRINPPMISVEDYISAIDEIIFDKQRLNYHLLLLKIMNSLTENILLKRLKIDSGPPEGVEIIGKISVSNTLYLKKELSIFISNLKNNIPSIHIPSLEEVDIKKVGKERYEFEIKFGFD